MCSLRWDVFLWEHQPSVWTLRLHDTNIFAMELWRTKETLRSSTEQYGYQTAIMLFLKSFLSYLVRSLSIDGRNVTFSRQTHWIFSFDFENKNMFRLWVSGFWHCAVLYVNANVLEEFTATPWKVKIKVWHWSDRIQVWHRSDRIRVWYWSDRIQVWHWSDRVQVWHWSDRIQAWHWSDRIQVWHWSDRVQAINQSGS